jgi:hypothetical protein
MYVHSSSVLQLRTYGRTMDLDKQLVHFIQACTGPLLNSMTSTIYKGFYDYIWRPKSKTVWDRCTTVYYDISENSRCSLFSRGRFSERSNTAMSCLFVLEMFTALKTVCMQMAAAGLLHISVLTFRGLNISFKLRFTTTHFLVVINFQVLIRFKICTF